MKWHSVVVFASSDIWVEHRNKAEAIRQSEIDAEKYKDFAIKVYICKI